MKIFQYYSGSSGNLYAIESNNQKQLIVEFGVNWKKAIKAIGYNFQNIEGMLCSHSHLDHSKSMLKAMNSGIDVYASEETFIAHGLNLNRRAKIIKDGSISKLPSFNVLCFDTQHDCPGSLGFVIKDLNTKELLLFATDTAYLRQRFTYKFSIIMLECSYDRDVLGKRVESGDINETLAKRLLESHMEWHNTLRYLQDFCDLSKCHEIHLLHLSRDNIDAEYVRSQIEKTTFIETKIKETIVT